MPDGPIGHCAATLQTTSILKGGVRNDHDFETTTNRVCIAVALLGLMLMLTGDVRAEETEAAADAAPAAANISDTVLRGEVDALWTCIAAFLVFFMLPWSNAASPAPRTPATS